MTIIDISVGGAMIAGNDLPSHGDRVVLVASGLEAAGVVAWRQHDRCGVSFRGDIDPLVVVRMNMPQLALLARRSAARLAALRS